MKPIAFNNAPGLNGAHETVGRLAEGEQQRRQAWLREMERAQLASWLSHGVVLGQETTRVTPAPSDQAIHRTNGPAVDKGRSAASHTVSVVGCEFARAAGSALGGGAAEGVLRFGQPGVAVFEGNTALAEATTLQHALTLDGIHVELLWRAPQQTFSGLAVPRLAPQPQPVAPGEVTARGCVAGKRIPTWAAHATQETVRVHAEWTPEGVRLWLALSAKALPRQEWIAQQVCQWMATQGSRVLSLCCNGRNLQAVNIDTNAVGFKHGSDPDSATEERTWL
jgi:hypothetical protein